jgi:hypothetical protein
MKKILILSLLAFSFSKLHAQSPSFGLKIGSNFSNLEVKDGRSSDYMPGIHVGGLAHVHLSPQWALQPEVVFSSQGGSFTAGSLTNKFVLNYVNVPVLFQYMFNNGFRLQAGPQIGFLVNAKNKSNNLEVDLKNDYKSTAVSLPIGLGYLFDSGLGIDGRWVPGISPINKTGNTTTNNVFQLGLFYQFDNHK